MNMKRKNCEEYCFFKEQKNSSARTSGEACANSSINLIDINCKKL